MKHTNKKGFTIVELVIVIAVIAILAAVLIPNLSRLVTKADKSAAMQEAKAAMDNDLINAEGDLENMEKYVSTDRKVQYYVVGDYISGATLAEGDQKATIDNNGTVTITDTETNTGTETNPTKIVHAYNGFYSKTDASYTIEKGGFTCTFANGEWTVADKK